MNAWAQGEGQPGLGYIFWRKERRSSRGPGPVAKNIGEERTEAIRTAARPRATATPCSSSLGRPGEDRTVRRRGAHARSASDLNLVDRDRFELCWIVDFPFYEWSEEEKRDRLRAQPLLDAAGRARGAERRKDPLSIKAYQYDAVCNGFEIASGSIRNQQPETMVKAFELTGKSRAEVEEQFGGLYRAFQYGAPPHGGMARRHRPHRHAARAARKNLREITLFPMNQQAEDLLMGAPSGRRRSSCASCICA